MNGLDARTGGARTASPESASPPPSGDRLHAIGLACWVLIVPIKLLRFFAPAAAHGMAVGVAPSFLATAGLFLLLADGKGRLARPRPARVAMLTAAIALTVEFAQLLPRPGVLAQVFFTFDWLDVIASLAGVGAGYLLASLAQTQRGA